MSANGPATEDLIKEVEFTHTNALMEKYIEAHSAQSKWKRIPLESRIECIKDFAALLLENKEELSTELTLEVGKPITQSISEIEGAASKCDFFILNSEDLLKRQKLNQDGATEEIIDYDPLGVIGHISAWNYPYLVGINIFVPALIAGNAVLYKPSEHCPKVGDSIARLLWQAGVPKEVFQVLHGDHKCGQAMLHLPLDGYFFTGSNAVGKKIASAVAPKLVPMILELGGKDPLYVTNDLSNVDNAAEQALDGAFYNNGQSCCSVERIYVHEDIYHEFRDKFIQKVSELSIGDPLNPCTYIGKVTRKAHMSYLEEQIQDALSKGAKLECGGKRIDEDYFEPTVLTNVTHDMKLMQEETFGPVIGIQKVISDAQAIELMNDTEYGLTSSVFCSDRLRGERILKEINSGTGYLNCADRVSSYLPWAGRKGSGLGCALSKHGLYAFCAPKGYHLR
ncbi:MAG: aldehyde dehydrogenase family protein [Bacteriovoracaceae bacterium]|nr:aldehyde dehydrogenase family protein [Bacteriovoracaceae bacterium]